jgi:hypothetical protein
MSNHKPKDNNALIELIAYEMGRKMAPCSLSSVADAERNVMRLITGVKEVVKEELWPHILHACLHGMAERAAKMSVAGKIVGTLWALDPKHRMSQDDIRDLCLSRHHDELLKLLDSRGLKRMIGL